ncbi:MAG: hypothetical protein SynsKO_35250 [Synoicihabitans sp.]
MSDHICRIAIIGTESTGKSTLAAALAEHFEAPWAPEYVRAFWDRREGKIDAVDLPTIARGQIANEEAAIAKADRVVFFDATLLMNVRWADDLHGGQIPSWIRQAADERANAAALHLYCAADLPWEADPQRAFADPVVWQASAERCRRMLTERGLAYEPIVGAGEQRLARAIAAVEAVLEAKVRR